MTRENGKHRLSDSVLHSLHPLAENLTTLVAKEHYTGYDTHHPGEPPPTQFGKQGTTLMRDGM